MPLLPSLVAPLLVGAVVVAEPPDSPPSVIPTLAAPVDVAVDAFGVPTIAASSLADAAAAQGYLHARDRFVAMDLFRRLAAGELAQVLGALALAHDQGQRPLQCRRAAVAALEALPPEHRLVVESYAAGVNAGLASLETPPPEYALLQLAPSPWRPEDTFLVYLWIAQMLADGARSEVAIGRFVELLPEPWVAFFRSPASRWSTTVVPEDAPMPAPRIPDAQVLAVRELLIAAGTLPAPPAPTAAPERALALGRGALSAEELPGSNGWAVRGADGHAYLANDMHLPLTVPFVWYRCAFELDGGDGAVRRFDGLSLPGVPAFVVGTNGAVAWGFTNVEGDFMDHVVVELVEEDAAAYRVPEGVEPFETIEERIEVRGGEAKSLPLRRTRWGPVVAEDPSGRPLALRWTALEPAGLNLALLDMLEASSVVEALDVAARWRGTQQNVTVADRAGSIGWTISGLLPARRGFDGLVPVSWADGRRGWATDEAGRLLEIERPRVVDPPTGRIVTANQRTLPAADALALGTRFGEPDRAARIDALLVEAQTTGILDEAALAAMQLDTRVDRLVRWRDAILPALRRAASERAADGSATERAARLGGVAAILEAWDGRADADATAVAIVDLARRGIRLDLERAIVGAALLERARAVGERLEPAERAARLQRLGRLPAPDERFLELVEAAADHLVPAEDADWDGFIARRTLEAAAQSRIAQAGAGGAEAYQRWGRVNASDFAHPLAAGMPLLRARFGLPSHEQPGHPAAVRVAGARFGASNRLVVSPGREEHAILQTPGGQSADPDSPHYADLHPSWRDGVAVPLRPGTATRRLRFEPKPSSDAQR